MANAHSAALLLLTAGAAHAWSAFAPRVASGVSRAACPSMECTTDADRELMGVVEPLPSSVPARRLDGTGKPTMWSEFGQLAVETGAVNLGQGFPDWQPPKFVVEAAHQALRDGFHGQRATHRWSRCSRSGTARTCSGPSTR